MAEIAEDKCVDSKYCRQMLTLSENDIKEGRVYIAKLDATIFCPTAFGYPSNQRRVVEDLIFYDCDIERKPWTIRFHSDGDRYYLTRGWSQFARVKKLSEGDLITIYELKSRKGIKERAFMVGVTRKMDVFKHLGVDLTKTNNHE
jgi:hypothetical protein